MRMVWLRETEIHPFATQVEEHSARLHINYRPCSGQKWPPKDDGDLGVLIHFHDDEVIRDEELTHLN